MIYRLVVISHVLAAIVGLGCMAAVPVLRRCTAPEVHLQVELRLAQHVMTPALAWSLVTGLVQVTVGPYAFGDIFVDVSGGCCSCCSEFQEPGSHERAAALLVRRPTSDSLPGSGKPPPRSA